MAEKNNDRLVAENRKARHNYFIEDTFEAGMVLTGTEVKSLRQGRANLKDSYARIKNRDRIYSSTSLLISWAYRSINCPNPR